MLGSHPSLFGATLAALALSLIPATANAASHSAKRPRLARVVSQHPCSKRAVEAVAGTESATIALARCDGSASPEGVDKISILVRPSGVARPKEPLAVSKSHGPQLAPGIRRLEPHLVEKLEQLVDQFHKSGQRTHLILAPTGSSSPAAISPRGMVRSIDFRIEGVTATALTASCKALSDAECTPSARGPFIHIELGPSGSSRTAQSDPVAAGSPTTASPVPASSPKLPTLPTAEHPAAVASPKTGSSERFF